MQAQRGYPRSRGSANGGETSAADGAPGALRTGLQGAAIGPGIALSVAGLTVFLAYSGGGFFPGVTAVATLILCLATVMRITLTRRPLAGVTPALVLPLALLAAFAVWTLTSAAWSDAPARALLEFDRVLLYILALGFFGMVGAGRGRLDWGMRGLAAGATVICVGALITRVAPDLWPIAANVHADRLSFPLTYWNALGLIAAVGLVACVHLAAGEREPRLARVLGAAATPVLAATLLLTFSRGSLVLVPVGVLIYAVAARPRWLLTALAAIVPPMAVVLVATFRADLLATDDFDSAAAIAQGHDLALVVLLCVLGAGLVRALLTPIDARLAALRRPAPSWRAKLIATAVSVVALGGLALAMSVPERVDAQWDRFVAGDVVDAEAAADTRSRLTDAGNNGRLDHWEVAVDSWRTEPLIGTGAGTYQLLWARERPYGFTVNDGHSLYVEVLGELGIVGFVLVVGAIAAMLAGVARRISGPQRHVHAAVLAAGTVWAIHAGIDWDWEMPAVTLWLFALAGLALSTPRGRPGPTIGEPARMTRVVAALGVGVLAITPAATAVSQARLDEAVAAFQRDDCAGAIDAALDSLDALRVRPQPYEIIGYCDAREGEHRLALRAMRSAVDRDPDSWETHYGLAIVRAAAGLDPRPQLATARRLNPLEPMVRDAARAMRGDDPQKWERRALRARLPIY